MKRFVCVGGGVDVSPLPGEPGSSGEIPPPGGAGVAAARSGRRRRAGRLKAAAPPAGGERDDSDKGDDERAERHVFFRSRRTIADAAGRARRFSPGSALRPQGAVSRRVRPS